jgi:glucose-fructose oxidoreductase
MQMDNDAKAIMQNSPVLVPGEEGLADIRVVEAIYKAAKEGKRVRL